MESTPKNTLEHNLVHAHDKAFKNAMQDIRVARDFCEHYLPDRIKKLVDLDTLTLENGTFIDQHLKESESDILYRAHIRGANTQAYIYVLAEHQSKPDRWVPFRLVKYLCEIASKHLKQYPQEKRLPLVVPIVFYNGMKSYPYSMHFLDLFGDQKEEATNIFLNAFQLVDLNQISDDEIRKHRWSGLMEMVMKQEKMRDLLSTWNEIIDAFGSFIFEEVGGEAYFSSMLTYSFYQGDIANPGHFFAMIRKQLALTNTIAEEKVMTLAERLIQWGKKEGREEGKQKGKQEGM